LSDSTCLRHWDEFIDSLGRLTHGRVAWVRADERRWSGCASPEIPLHYHALLKYQNVPAIEAVAGLWKTRAGDARVEIYDPGEGAAWYMAKMFPYEDTRYDMGGSEDFVPYLEEHLARPPGFLEAHGDLGKAHAALGRNKQSIAELLIASPTDHSGELNFELSTLYREEDELELARKALEESERPRSRGRQDQQRRLVRAVGAGQSDAPPSQT